MPTENERRFKPCGSDSCCYTNDREYVENLEFEANTYRTYWKNMISESKKLVNRLGEVMGECYRMRNANKELIRYNNDLERELEKRRKISANSTQLIDAQSKRINHLEFVVEEQAEKIRDLMSVEKSVFIVEEEQSKADYMCELELEIAKLNDALEDLDEWIVINSCGCMNYGCVDQFKKEKGIE